MRINGVRCLPIQGNKRKTLVFLILFIPWLIFTLTACSSTQPSAKKRPVVVDGILDLGDWDFGKDGPIKLSGKWEFYWKQLLEPQDFESKTVVGKDLIRVPGPWTRHKIYGKKLPDEGYATYRLRIKSNKPVDHMAIKYRFIESSCKIWIDKKLVLQSGRVGENAKSYKGRINPEVVPVDFHNGVTEVIVQVSNFGYIDGGFIVSLTLGEVMQIVDIRNRLVFGDIFIFSTVFMIGLYHLVWFITIREDKSTLYFSMICLLVSVRVLIMGEMLLFSLIPVTMICKRLSTFTLSMGLVFMVMLLRSIFPDETPRWFVRFSQVTGILYSVIVLFTPGKVSAVFYQFYEMVALPSVFYLLIIIIKAVKHKRTGSKIVLTAVSILFITCINDILTQLGFFRIGYFIPQGFTLFIYVQAFMLASKFSNSFHTIKVLSTKLLSLDKLKDQFLANTSHELKTPLNGIVGIAQSMLDGAAGDLDENKRHNLWLIAASGKRLSNLVNDLLDLSKLKNNEIYLQKKTVDVKSVVNIVLALAKTMAGNKNLELKNSIPDDLPLVEADENRLEQIIVNLVGNAVKFTEEGYVEVSALVKDRVVHISVKDTGIGIPEDRKEDIFKSFEQGDGSVSRKYGGTGLGLNITKKLVELHAGNIWVISSPGIGSTFTFSLPLPASTELVPVKRDNPPVSSYTAMSRLPVEIKQKPVSGPCDSVLVVDDDPVNLQVMVNILSLHNYRVITEQSGKEALDRMENGRNEFSLIILDIMMPGMSGFEFCRTIRERYSLLDIPVLMLTAKNKSDHIQAGFEAGANDYLEKPFDKLELMARVKSLIAIKKLIKKEEMLYQSELRTLQAQIKPHFLFNALNTIIHMCRVSPEKAISLLTDLSNYLRCGFSFKNDEEFIGLDKEILHVKSYLALEMARFQGRLNVIFDIDENIQCNIPPFILQPIVENAVKHGLFPKVSGGTVKISIKRLKDKLVLTVEDNGIGIPEERIGLLLREEDKKAGIGVANVNKRIEKIYGERLFIESRLDFGTKVTIRIPGKQHKEPR